MIASQKRGLSARLLHWYIARKLRRQFRGVWQRGELPTPKDGGVLLYANHSGFWDAFVAHTVVTAGGWDGHAWMEERNLTRYRFLRGIGAFSVRRGDAASSLAAMRESRRLVALPKTAVLLFPEGEQRLPGAGPLRLERGLEVLARVCRVPCVPLAFRYAFFESEYPDVVVDVGAPHDPEPLEGFSRRLNALVDGLRATPRLEGFRPLVRGRTGVADRWDAARGLPPRA